METNEVYHITTKSIARYIVFNNDEEYERMKKIILYYQVDNPLVKYSYFNAHQKDKKEKFISKKDNPKEEKLVRIIAYCLMPTHVHLILQQVKEKGISVYMNRVLNSYTRYFNVKHRRKGPLWEGRFKRILVATDEQLIHLTRYVHLNPVTAYLVDRPENWLFSSYCEYIEKIDAKDRIFDIECLLEIKPDKYRQFTNDQISYQRELQSIKKLILE